MRFPRSGSKFSSISTSSPVFVSPFRTGVGRAAPIDRSSGELPVTAGLIPFAASAFAIAAATSVVWYAEGTIAASMVVMALLLAWRHKENIQRLMAGKESRLGSKKDKPGAEAGAPSGKAHK